ncbi:MAG: glycerophosphodiester phosphodiesterase, partial [Clostridiales bacterium]|nr:glycerophosphodiester phosphodiesterase [Clostridiales bacterium]
SESTYEQLTAKPLKNSKTGDDVRLCSFREYLEIMKKYGMVCFVELKGEYTDPQVKGVFDLVEQVYDLKKCILQSFSVENLQKARALFPSLPLMLTYGLNESHYEICFEYGLSLDIDYLAFKEEMIEQFHSRGLEIALWTVNDPDDFERMKKYNVDYIESDVFGG